jgi:hypothetical protein
MLEKAKLIICTIVKAATLCAAPEMQSSNGRQPFHTSALDRFRNCDQTSQCSRVNLYVKFASDLVKQFTTWNLFVRQMRKVQTSTSQNTQSTAAINHAGITAVV